LTYIINSYININTMENGESLREIEVFIDTLNATPKITKTLQKRAKQIAENIDDIDLLESERRILKYRLLDAAELPEAEACSLTAVDWCKIYGVTRRTIYTRLGDEYKNECGQKNNTMPAKILREATREFIELPFVNDDEILVIDGIEHFAATPLGEKMGIPQTKIPKVLSLIEGVKGRTTLGRIRTYYSAAQMQAGLELLNSMSKFDEHGLYILKGHKRGTVAAWARKLNLEYGVVLRALKSLPSIMGENPNGKPGLVYKESDVMAYFSEPMVHDGGFVTFEEAQVFKRYGTKKAWAKHYGIDEGEANKISIRKNVPHIGGRSVSSGQEVYLYLEEDVKDFFEKRKYPKANIDNVIVTENGVYKTAFLLSRELASSEPTIKALLQKYVIKGMTQNGHIVDFYPEKIAVNFLADDFLQAAEADEEAFEELSKLDLEEIIAVLQDDPVKLKRYLQFAHPELLEQDLDRLVLRSFKGLRDNEIEKSEDKYLSWNQKLPSPKIQRAPISTDLPTLTLCGTSKGATHIFIAGVYTRRKRVGDDGSYTITIPLKVGEQNEIRLMLLNTDDKVRSDQNSIIIDQEGEKDDIASLVELLSNLKEQTFSNIQRHPGRLEFLSHSLEQSLIRKFGRSFAEGERYVEILIEKPTTKPVIRRILARVLKKFIRIHRENIPGVVEGSLLFFQKYCALEIRRRIDEALPGVILANDPGTGKTRIVQAALADEDTAVITPNQVVTAWEEEADRVLENTHVLALHSTRHEIRKEILRTRSQMRKSTTGEDKAHHTYVNREFIRKTDDQERFDLLCNDDMVVVHDEAHSRANEGTEQSKGAGMLHGKFQVLVTATPFKNPQTFRRMMTILKPNDNRFKSEAAFIKAFSPDDAHALKALSLLKDDVTLRFRKEDIFETVNPRQSLKQQHHKLPAKEFVPPEVDGEFVIGEEQADSIYRMFTHWNQWCRKNNKFIPKDSVAQDDHVRISSGFAKKHALRQTINNPSYIGSEETDNKLKKVKEIVAKCLRENRKVVIFCAYEAQALKYAEAFSKYNPALYTGQTSKIGETEDQDGGKLKFKKGDTGDGLHGWILDAKGYPIPDSQGEKMPALDYERITFQNVSERQILIATYNAGSVGTTFTAGKAMIFDDLPSDCIEAIQAEDRIHRIDPERLTHAELKYYTMRSAYPETFIERMKGIWLVRHRGRYREFKTQEVAQRFASRSEELEAVNAYEYFFALGTYDQVHSQNLIAQRTLFRLINDGIADESVLDMNQQTLKGLNGDVKNI
jgi:hypothetical protein